MSELSDQIDAATAKFRAVIQSAKDIDSLYYIYCHKRSWEEAYWWRGNRCGYTPNINEAGMYTKEEADRIAADSRGENFGIPVAEVLTQFSIRQVVVPSDGNNWQRIKDSRPTHLQTGDKP